MKKYHFVSDIDLKLWIIKENTVYFKNYSTLIRVFLNLKIYSLI